MTDDRSADPARPKSRWSVEPGSVSESFRRTTPSPPVPSASEDSDAPRRRPASEILAEARAAGTPTRSRRERNADTPPPSRQRGEPHELDLRGPDAPSAFDDELEPTRATPKRPVVPATNDSVFGPTDADPQRQPAKRPLNAPVQGDRQEMRSPDGLGHAPAAILAGFGGVLLIIITTAVGAIIDFLVSGMVGLFAAIGLAAGAAFAALITRKRDLLTILVAPPLVYSIIGALVLLASSRPASVTSVAQLAISGFPAMAIATGLAAIIIGIKLMTTRVGERR